MNNRNLPPVTTSDSNSLAFRSIPVVEGDWNTCANLKIRAVNGRVKCNVYLNNVPHESFDVTMDFRDAKSFLREAARVIDGKTNGIGGIRKSPRRNGKEVSREVYPDGELAFVRQNDGIFTLVASHPKCPVKITFLLRPSRFFSYTDGNGQELPDQEQSRIIACGHLDAIEAMLPITINETDTIRRVNEAGKKGEDKTRQAVALFMNKQKDNTGGGQQNGSYQKQGYGGNQQSGSYQKQGYSGNQQSGGYSNQGGSQSSGYQGSDVFDD